MLSSAATAGILPADRALRSTRYGCDDLTVREAERPVEERLSVLDRPRSDHDSMFRPSALSRNCLPFVDPSTLRLALDDKERQIYVAPDSRADADTVYVFLEGPGGGGAAGHPRSVLRTNGATIMMQGSSREQGLVVCGVVPDHVSAVTVGGVEAILTNNAYLADVSSRPESIELMTATGKRRVNVPGRLSQDE